MSGDERWIQETTPLFAVSDKEKKIVVFSLQRSTPLLPKIAV